MTIAHRPTTGIGSLPHHNVDSALEFSFKFGIPFLPQIPRRNPWEYMIPQALEGLPGLETDSDGVVSLNTDVFFSRYNQFTQKLERAISGSFEEFEPGSATSSSWQPFLWEIAERSTPLVKIQLAGPLTCQWAIRLKNGENADKYPEISTAIYRLILARAIAMSRRIRERETRVLFFLDEPALYLLNRSNPRHLLALQELKLLVQTLSKEKVRVGIHCCSNTDWSQVLGLGIDILSLDCELSLDSLLAEHRPALDEFVAKGGTLSLGVIPTGGSSYGLHSSDPKDIYERLKPKLGALLSKSIFSPACGLALQSPSDAEFILDSLTRFADYCES